MAATNRSVAQFGDLADTFGRLSDAERGDLDRLMALVYQELRGLADRTMRAQRINHTLQATALTHEVYLKLHHRAAAPWQSRGHFLAVAARAMRQILVDHERARGTQKRGGGLERLPLADVAAVSPRPQLDLIALDGALDRLARHDPRKARVVELLYFGGMTAAEVAGVLEVTSRTVERDWHYARAWLLRELDRGE